MSEILKKQLRKYVKHTSHIKRINEKNFKAKRKQLVLGYTLKNGCCIERGIKSRILKNK